MKITLKKEQKKSGIILEVNGGKKNANHYRVSLGILEGELTPGMEDKTLRELAGMIARGSEIEKGDITLLSINFNFKRVIKEG